MFSDFGKTAVDQVTGFKGTITGYAEYISGCAQVLIVPKVADNGSFVDGQWFDVQRTSILKGKQVVLDNSKTPGPDKVAPRRY